MAVTRIVPYTNGRDVAGSRAFYVDLLGLEVGMEQPVLALRSPANASAQVIVEPEGFEDPQPAFGVDVGDVSTVDAVHTDAVERELNIVYPLTDETWGVRRFFVEDPGGSIVNVLAHHD